jgi:transposase-like protein
MQKQLHVKSEERKQILERWKESGKSVRQFCQDESININTFHYWRGRLKKEKSSGFIKLQPEVSAFQPAYYCEVTLRNGNRVLFHQSPGAKVLRGLLR